MAIPHSGPWESGDQCSLLFSHLFDKFGQISRLPVGMNELLQSLYSPKNGSSFDLQKLQLNNKLFSTQLAHLACHVNFYILKTTAGLFIKYFLLIF